MLGPLPLAASQKVLAGQRRHRETVPCSYQETRTAGRTPAAATQLSLCRNGLRKQRTARPPTHRPRRTAANAQRQRIEQIRSTIARPVIAERVDALVGQFQAHLVRQDRERAEEVGGRGERLHPRAGHVPVALQLHVLEVQRLMAQLRGRPGEGDRRERSRLEDSLPSGQSRGRSPSEGVMIRVNLADAFKILRRGAARA